MRVKKACMKGVVWGGSCKWSELWSGGMGEKKYLEMVWTY